MRKETAGEVVGHPLWMLPVFLLVFLVLIETLHTWGHLRMEIDVHGYCFQNKEHLERMNQEEDDW